MSRTYKDKPWKYRDDTWKSESVKVEGYSNKYDQICFYWIKLPGVKKKRKRSFVEWGNWMYTSAPSWFTRMYMNRPARRKAHMFEQLCLNNSNLENLDGFITNDKAFVYYY
jgi:hypothetical protein